MELNLKGKVVLVTGGSKGIGKAIAKAFLDEGAVVAIAARSKEDLERTRSELGEISTYSGDLTVSTAREQVFRHLSRNMDGLTSSLIM